MDRVNLHEPQLGYDDTDPDGYRAYVDLKEKAFRKTLADQKAAASK